MDIRVEITVLGLSRVIIARTQEMSRKTATNMRITSTSRFSSILSFMKGFIISRVRVELEVSTSEERVDIEAERTRTMTTPKSRSGRLSIIEGIIASKPFTGSPASLALTNSLPKPP